MTCTLILMRHAKSDHGDRSLSDHARPLNGRGRKDSRRMADWLESHDCVPDRVLCSTAARTRETLELLCRRWSTPPEVAYCESLYLASCESILWTISSQCGVASRLLVLGHNPGMSVVSSVLSQRALELPTAALAVLRFEDAPEKDHPLEEIGASAGGEFLHFVTPKMIG